VFVYVIILSLLIRVFLNNLLDTPHTRHMPGRLPSEAQAAAFAIGEEAKKKIDQLALQFGKDPRQLMAAAGMKIHGSRVLNSYNAFVQWYWHHHPKPDDGMF
jgi:hypothetical protein